MIVFVCTLPFLRIAFMGCHENHALTHSQNKFFYLRTKMFCIHGVPMNKLAPMKNCPLVGVQGRSK